MLLIFSNARDEALQSLLLLGNANGETGSSGTSFPTATPNKSPFLFAKFVDPTNASFLRGASNTAFSLDYKQAAKGVATHSSGNHAAALALAAQLHGIPEYIVRPKNSPKCKVVNVKRYGVRLYGVRLLWKSYKI
ncbi:hypothetical protein L2E82_39655 [Cichorium intybus]|uniref:Uncharacterized protein n=1 Tax=Cichorium intybus TaxID=13427 RepID=A0ACB9AJ46_CICIN|nr:hypothetical protein L2E82_39655 [Cichorium intybus]